MNDNQMKPLQALELLMTRLQPSEDNIAKARVEFETVKSALEENQEVITNYKTIRNRLTEDLKKYSYVIAVLRKCIIIARDPGNERDMPCLILGIRVSKENLIIIYETHNGEEIEILKGVFGNNDR